MACGAEVTVIAPDVVTTFTARPDVVVAAPLPPGRRRGFLLVITATGDPAVDGTVFADAEHAGVWVNSADDPARCSFMLPAVTRQGPVIVSVSTDGTARPWPPGCGTGWPGSCRRRRPAGCGGGPPADDLHETGRTTEGLPWPELIDALAVA